MSFMYNYTQGGYMCSALTEQVMFITSPFDLNVTDIWTNIALCFHIEEDILIEYILKDYKPFHEVELDSSKN